VSTDTHTSSPRHGDQGQHAGVDERQAGYGPVRRGRLATVEAEHDARLARVAAEPTGLVPEAPLTWARDSGVLPTVSRTPRLRQMLGVCGWAALLGAVGLVVGIRGFIADLMSTTPGWYEPVMIGAGAIGIAFTVGAFATVHRRRMPYILLSAATITLAYATLLTATSI
jgi:hypothetical protein